MPTTCYTYKDPYPMSLNRSGAVQLKSKADWPRSYRCNPNHVSTQGIHPPGPIYNSNQPAAQPWSYYHTAQASLMPRLAQKGFADHYQQAQAHGGYYVNGQYYPAYAVAGMSYSPSNYYYFY